MEFDRLASAVESAVAVMTEASDDIKWLKDHPKIVEVVKDDPEAAKKLEELADKLEAASGALKMDTDATNPPEPAPEPVVEEPAPEAPVEAPVEEPVVEETPSAPESAPADVEVVE